MRVALFLKKLLNSGSERSVIIKKNIVGSFAVKGLSILTSLALVPLTLKMLDNEKYGIWITLYSIVTWFNIMDIGLGNGFRNKFAEAVALNKIEKARKLTEAIYGSSIIIAFVFFVVYFAVHPFLNWHKILNVSYTFDENISQIVFWVFVLFSMQMIFKNIGTILLALQKTVYSNMVQFLGSLLALIAIMFLGKLGLANLRSISVTFMVSPLLVYLFYTIVLFQKKLKSFIPRNLKVESYYFREIINLGIKFFFIQITTIVMFSSGNFIITQFYGPEQVTPYNISYRLFASTMSIFTIIIAPFWSAYTEAMARNDYEWIKMVLKKLNLVWIVFVIGLLALLIVSPWIYKIWVGEHVEISFLLSASFAIYAALLSWSGMFAQFLNGVGKIKIQLYIAIFQCITNIPLAIFLAKHYNFGITGIIFATNINLLISSIILPMQVYRIINKRDYGMWSM